MKILIVGNLGNMGRRYQLICESLGCEVTGWDTAIGKGIEGRRYSLDQYAGVIIATPTCTHLNVIEGYAGKLPILCDKPICTNLKRIDELLAIPGINLRMINQYEYFENQRVNFIKEVKSRIHTDVYDSQKKTYYNYFKHGADGILWDCINIIGLAQGPCEIAEDSLVWECVINGHRCELADIDRSYIWNITDWLGKFDNNHNYIKHAHRKVLQMQEVPNGVD